MICDTTGVGGSRAGVDGCWVAAGLVFAGGALVLVAVGVVGVVAVAAAAVFLVTVFFFEGLASEE